LFYLYFDLKTGSTIRNKVVSLYNVSHKLRFASGATHILWGISRATPGATRSAFQSSIYLNERNTIMNDKLILGLFSAAEG
jgi:hypothetical protein